MGEAEEAHLLIETENNSLHSFWFLMIMTVFVQMYLYCDQDFIRAKMT